MTIGELNKRVTLQYPTVAKDSLGTPVTTWNDAATVWAAIWPVSANEIVKNNASVMIITHRIRIRFRSVLKSSWRIKFGNRYFSIVSIINPNEAREYLDIMCKEAA